MKQYPFTARSSQISLVYGTSVLAGLFSSLPVRDLPTFLYDTGLSVRYVSDAGTEIVISDD